LVAAVQQSFALYQGTSLLAPQVVQNVMGFQSLLLRKQEDQRKHDSNHQSDNHEHLPQASDKQVPAYNIAGETSGSLAALIGT
jgi:hypothetical protein